MKIRDHPNQTADKGPTWDSQGSLTSLEVRAGRGKKGGDRRDPVQRLPWAFLCFMVLPTLTALKSSG